MAEAVPRLQAQNVQTPGSFDPKFESWPQLNLASRSATDMRDNRSSSCRGFTLIEVMIVVAIIGTLAAVAIPTYTEFVAKSQMSTALAEISAGKVSVEIKVTEEKSVSSPEELGLLSSTLRCDITASFSPIGNGELACALKGNSRVQGKVIKLQRTADSDTGLLGRWSCSTTADVKVTPKQCV